MLCSTLPPETPTIPSLPFRPALATSSTSRTGTSTSRAATSRTEPSPAIRPTSNRPLQIFMDPTGAESQAAEAAAGTWSELGTRKTRIKENVPEVKKLGGTTLKQAGRTKRVASASGSSTGASSSKIIPYRDPNPSDMPPPPVPVAKKVRDTVIVPRTPTKNAITPFVDGQDGPVSEGIPTTPLFTPFRDEVWLHIMLFI